MNNTMNASTSVPGLTQKLISWRIQWPEDPALKQNFALPSCMVYYIAKNSSTPKCYSKMVQCCKYFFEKKPILIVSDVKSQTIICSGDFYQRFKNHDKCCMKINHNKNVVRIWLTNEIFLNYYTGKYFFKILCSRFYRCDISTLILRRQNIDYDDFKLLATSAKLVDIYEVNITYKNGSDVLFETILGCIPKIQKLEYWFDMNVPVVTSSTFKNIAELKNLGNLMCLRLFCVPEIASVKDLISYSMGFKNAMIYLSFDPNISEAYKSQLNALIDDLIKFQTTHRLISYIGLDFEKFKTLASLYTLK